MSKLICRVSGCGNTFFAKVNVNEFHDYGGSLYNMLPEVVPATDVKAYQCVKCGSITLPTLDWSTPDADRKLAKQILDIADGKDVKPETKMNRSTRPVPGYMTPVNDQRQSDPSQQGTFVRQS